MQSARAIEKNSILLLHLQDIVCPLLILSSVAPLIRFFPGSGPSSVLVTDSVTNSLSQTYSTDMVYRGVLPGGKRLQESNTGFT